MQRNNRPLIILGIVIFLVTITVIFNQFIYRWQNDTLSNVMGTLAGGLGSIIFIFWQLDYEKRKQERLDVVNLLNLIDEFPTLIGERVLQDSLREEMTGIANFKSISKVLEEYGKELHTAVDKAETTLLIVGYKHNSNLQRFLREVNVAQLTLRELVESVSKCEKITQDNASLSREERVSLIKKVERKKFYVISSLKDLIKDLEKILKAEGRASEINVSEITREINNFDKDKYEKVFEKIKEVAKDIQPEQIDDEHGCWYLQADITNKADLIIPSIKKEKLELPSDIFRYYQGKEDSIDEKQDEGKNIIRHILLCMALLGEAKFYQEKLKGNVKYCF